MFIHVRGTCTRLQQDLYKVSNDWKIRIVSKRNNLFVNHKSEDSHHSSTSVVELDSTLLKLGLLIKVIPSEVNVSVTEVTNELVSGSWNILHESNLKKTDEGNKLNKSSSWDGVRSDKGGNSVRVGVEGVSGVVDASWKVDSSAGDNLSKESKLGDTSVLDLYVTKAVETFLVNISVQKSKRIEESKWWLSSKLVLECLDGSGGLGNLGRSESCGGSGEGGGDNEFHVDCFCSRKLCVQIKFD
mmetsp:Transcript_1784/g.2139  ORF Transcript_1784/g.2139 Transcript_1784/m.2139 type:complete len:243 (-) Transcript_1784:74-802(-)